MSAAEIKALTHPPSAEHAQSTTLQWLNEKFPSFDQFQDSDDLEQLVQQAASEAEQLKTQLASSQELVDSVTAQTLRDADAYLETVQELGLIRDSLSDELSYLSDQLVSSMSGPDRQPTLLEDLETLQRNLKELESVKSYVRVIHRALSLSEAAIRQAQNFSSHASVSDYGLLQTFVSQLMDKCAAVDHALGQQPLHLVTFLQTLRDRTWADIKSSLFALMTTVSEKLGWPAKVDYPSARTEDRKAFDAVFLDLLKLQDLGEQLGVPKAEGLYPIQALVHPIALRFRFHFEGQRSTNQLDKPEWYFTHILNVVHDQRPFIESIAQRLLNSTRHKNINAWREFVLLLLPVVTRKLKRSVPSLLPHPPVLAHTIYQAISFDGALREEGFGLSGTSAEVTQGKNEWKGTSDTVLGRSDWFNAWLQGEKQFALDQYHASLTSGDPWRMADDQGNESGQEQDLRPTNSARRVKALIEQVTDRYSALPDIGQRLDFLSTIQLPILDLYRLRISSFLDGFESVSASFVRAVPGAISRDPSQPGGENSTKRETTGVGGAQKLCKALISTKYVAKAMQGWGDEVFFLELWTEIVIDSGLRVRADEDKLMPIPPPVRGTESDGGSIFDKLIEDYGALVERAEEMVVQHVCGEIEMELRAHFFSHISGRHEEPSIEPQHNYEIEIPSTLMAPVSLFSSYLAYFQSSLSTRMLSDLYRKTTARISNVVLQKMVLQRGVGRIGVKERRAVATECELWMETSRAALSGGGSGGRGSARLVEGPWRRLVEAGRLLALQGSEWDRIKALTFGTVGDEDWERGILEIMGFSELRRDEVQTVLRTRTDS
ncbi:hypothetical protein BDM02DRAFT_3092586 [Thelephora ganbajun]|uniref:Uncharacterized protein n=1 Tax=Thelephora ganbajun TaxID=370292 RepID=A0ACB6ZN04_THEGA|nr:hypothetical protein BDM02DRAFT_3092586 [Thelephora ganbajun]